MAPTAAFSLEIDAPIETVWQAMIDVARYRDWNPFIVLVETADAAIRVGTKVNLHVRWGKGGGTISPEVIARVDAPSGATGARRAVLEYRFAGWLARLGIVRGTRVQTLTQRPGGGVVYETHEHFHGLLAGGVPLKKVQDGFERHARALKARAESVEGAALKRSSASGAN